MSSEKTNGYRSTLGATALIGGSAVVCLLCGLIRGKVVAVWLGPVGVGLLGAYQSIVELFVMIFSIGIGSSGVRVIAEAAGRGGDAAVAQVAWVIRRLAWVLGVLGGAVLLVFSERASVLTFGNAAEAGHLAWLGVAILAGALALGQNTVIQGMRRISQLAGIGVWGSVLGVVIGVPVVIGLGIPGLVWLPIVAALSNVAIATLVFSRLNLPPVYRRDVAPMSILSPLVRIGLLFTVNSIANSLLGWLVRTYVIRSSGLDVAGYFQVASNLSTIYVGMVLQAMSADYFPRLAAHGDDAKGVARSINEQLVVTVLVAAPGIVATLVMAPWVIEVFYSHTFAPALGILRWYLMASLVRAMAWPFSMAVYARGAARWVIVADMAAYAVNLLLFVPAHTRFGLNGVGIAFFAASCVNAVVAYLVLRRIGSFHLEGLSRRSVMAVLALVGASLLCLVVLPPGYNVVLGGLLAIATALHSLYAFADIVPGGRLEGVARLAGLKPYRTLKSRIKRAFWTGGNPDV
jgi:PST family polysaccharide transporter